MPELPELDVLAENLAARLAGTTVAAVRPYSVAALKTVDPPLDALVGRVVTGAGRRAKYVWLELSGWYLVVHLSLGGRISLGTKPPPRRGAVLALELADVASRASGGVASRAPGEVASRASGGVASGASGEVASGASGGVASGASGGVASGASGSMVLAVTEGGTQRRAAVWLVDDPEKVPGMAGLGPEPLDPGFTVEVLGAILAAGGHTLKGMLTDQKGMSGVGNAWSDDVLHRARLSPFARPDRLGPDEVARLHASLVGVLGEARGALAEQVSGQVVIPKASARQFAVHGRAGAACFVCGDTIRSVWMGERETSYCPACQTGGRVLADRRRSRFLK